MKTEFELENVRIRKGDRNVGKIWIGISEDEPPFVGVHLNEGNVNCFMKDKDIEGFAVNILKALKSKKLVVKDAKKKCPHCGSTKIITFDAGNDMCQKCHEYFPAL